jgi:hypothetical protein
MKRGFKMGGMYMSFREFTAKIESTRDFKEQRLSEAVLSDIIAYLREINAGVGTDKGFSFIMLDNGQEVFNDLEGTGGYSGKMIKSPHYIALTVLKEDPEIEFYGAYYMQSIVKKLYDLYLGSCWINVKSITQDMKSKLLKGYVRNINYLLAFGEPDEKAIKQKAAHLSVSSESLTYRQNPYGIKVGETSGSDKARHSISEIAYMYEWGKDATYEELEQRGMADILLYTRNAPSYKNLQPSRLIIKDGEAELAVMQPENTENYVDAGIMMYTFEGLAKDFGIPCKWQFVNEKPANKDYAITAKIEL